jgi:hypothetical protein
MEINSLELYRRLLRLGKEWNVVKVELDEQTEVLHMVLYNRKPQIVKK